jgi:diguanylate cyclase (GGDEF)-like protein/PAS domain S-box-containing protein
VFDSIARMASEVCGVPIALLSLVDSERQWFKANVGLPGVNETPRDVAFCAHAIEQDGVFEVPDAAQDARFSANPLVTGDPDIRFYAGAPLTLPGGERVGTLCVIDRVERKLDESQLKMLRSLAVIATQALQMRQQLIDRCLSTRTEYEQALASSEARHRAIVEDQAELISLAQPDGTLIYVNPAYARHYGFTPDLMIGKNLLEFVTPADRDAVARLIAHVLQTGEGSFSENLTRGIDGSDRWVAWTNRRQFDRQQRTLLHSVGRDVTERVQAEQALRELTNILENSTDFVVQTDGRGSITYMNPAARQSVGIGPGEPLGQRNFKEFNTPATNRLFTEVIGPSVAVHGVWVGETTWVGAGQRLLPVSHMVIAHRDAGGRIERFSAVMRDITAEVEAKRRLHSQTAILRSVTEAIPAIVADVGADQRYRFINGAFERWIGATRHQIIGRTMREVLGAADYERSRPWFERALLGETVQFEREYGARTTAKTLSVTYVPLRLDDGTVDGFVGVAQDITTHRQEAVRLLQLSQSDALTGLLNRAGFEAEIERHVARGDGASVALLFIDLDHFKPVNDQYGHPVGDQVLQIFAQRLRGLVRPTDTVARMGGDEFAVLLTGVREKSNAKLVADKVVAAAQARIELGELLLQIGASVGVAFGVDPVAGWRELMARADAMLYRAKEAGRGRHAGETR